MTAGERRRPLDALYRLMSNPDLIWVRIAEEDGRVCARAETMEAFNDLLAASTRRAGPFLIELMT